MAKEITVDVAIVGAGIAGCHLAQLLANHHLSVGLFDSKPLYMSGPHWINAVPLWMFDEAGLSRPQGKELFDINSRFIIRSSNKAAALTINNLGIADVNMSALGDRLKDSFTSGLGQSSFYQIRIENAEYDDKGRLIKLRGNSEQGSVAIRAKLFVDSSGISAVVRKCHPRANEIWPSISRANLCSAAQQTLEIRERAGAIAFLNKNRCLPTDVMADVGFTGGYSLLRWQIDGNLSHISVLCGIRAVPGYPSAKTTINKFVNENKWIGTHFVDGCGAIPLNAPYQTLVVPGLALLGDAAGQVYSAHGSGIGIGLIAAKILADTVNGAYQQSEDLGALSTLRRYERSFHKKFARRLKFSENFRKLSQNLDESAMASLISSGLISEYMARQTLNQEEPHLNLPSLVGLFLAIIKSPKIFAYLLKAMI